MSRGRLILVSVLVSSAHLLAMPALAPAGTFTALTCHDLAGNAIGTAGWSVGAANGQYITFASSCANGSQGSFGLTMGPNPTSEYFNGNGNTMTYSVPAGLTIASYSLNLYAFGGPCVVQDAQCANGFGDVFVNHTGQSDPNYDYRNLGYGAATTTVTASDLSDVTYVTVGVGCDPGQDPSYPCSGSADPEAQALVSGGSFTLKDATVPTVTNVSGSLIAGGTLTGTDTIDFTAADSGGGIYSATALIDGHPVAQEVPSTNGGSCVNLTPTSTAMTFPAPQPCPTAENISLSLNTMQFSAGEHHLQVIVTDAAGDTATAFDGTITTSGPPNVGVNGGSISGRGTPNGEPCAGEALELTVNGKRRSPSSVLYGKPVTVRGVLHCGTVPIRDARIVVNTVGAPASAAIDTTAQTALDGSFTYKLPTGPDRTLRFSYTAYSNDPGPSATATVTIAVRPKIRLRIRPSRTSNGDTIQWGGTITGGPYPPQGVTLDVEVREGRRWRFFYQIVTGRRGHFHYSYRFHNTTEPTTYTFRVALPDTGAKGYPYTHGASNTVDVHVSP
jgi:hypothetical protein